MLRKKWTSVNLEANLPGFSHCSAFFDMMVFVFELEIMHLGQVTGLV